MKLLIIEDRFSAGNPTTASMVMALPHLIEAGCEVEVWANSIDEELRDLCRFRRLRSVDIPFAPPIISSLMRHLIGGLRMVTDKLRGASKGKQVRHISSGGRFLFADVSVFHFYNKAWLRIQRAGIEWGPEWSIKGLRSAWGWLEDTLSLRSPWTKTFLPVSDAIGDEMRRDFPARAEAIRLLPNAVDGERYSPTLRSECGPLLREEFGYNSDDKVLLFVSQGHLARKGFWLALKVIAELRSERGDDTSADRPRLVLLGGRPKKLERIASYLESQYPDWRQWVELVGWTDRVQDYMAAADALFFPSYFEAFSLVEIEAAAVGLPLILTRHHGSEMILEDGVNGYACEFGIDEIKSTLRRFFEAGLEISEPNIGRALTPQQWALYFVDELSRDPAADVSSNDERQTLSFPNSRHTGIVERPAEQTR